MIDNIPKQFLDFSIRKYPVGNNSKNFDRFLRLLFFQKI